jgi:hypothetical protein
VRAVTRAAVDSRDGKDVAIEDPVEERHVVATGVSSFGGFGVWRKMSLSFVTVGAVYRSPRTQ